MSDPLQAEPLSKCGACGQTDDHPKHQVLVGFNNEHTGGGLFHVDDYAREGVVYYHFDCPSEWHDLAVKFGPHEDPDAQEQLAATAEVNAAIVAKAKSGVHGSELRQWIANLNPRGGAGGIDQVLATAILANLSPNSGTGTTVTITGPIKMRLMTVNGSDTAAGTELSTSGGYTAGGAAVGMGTAATGAVASNAAVSWTNMPSTTLTGMEQWTSDGTPKRSFWAPWSSGSIVVASGNTFTVASGNLTDSLA